MRWGVFEMVFVMRIYHYPIGAPFGRPATRCSGVPQPSDSILRTLHARAVKCWRALACALAIACLAGPSHAQFNGAFDGQARATRFVIELPKTVGYKAFVLRNPDRVVIDIPELPLRLPHKRDLKRSNLVKSYRYGVTGHGRARLIIKTHQPTRIVRTNMEPAAGSGWSRLNVELAPLRGKKTIASLMHGRSALGGPTRDAVIGDGDVGDSGLTVISTPTKKTDGDTTAPDALPMIVIDPGHGGRDSGAKKHGVMEKAVVLAFGKRLRDKLLSTKRYRVHMTRDDDTFVPLSRRAEIAREKKAALFLSVHADYAGGRWASARGATFYTLRPKTAKAMARQSAGSTKTLDRLVAANSSSIEVKSILRDIGRRWFAAKPTRTNKLVSSLKEYMGDATKVRKTHHRRAGFRVLRSAHMPGVLIELAYVSNRKDAKLLKSKDWRERVTSAVVKAVDNYFADSTVKVPL